MRGTAPDLCLGQCPYPCGRLAKEALTDLVTGHDVRCEPVDTDRYGRTVGAFAAGKDLAGELVRFG